MDYSKTLESHCRDLEAKNAELLESALDGMKYRGLINDYHKAQYRLDVVAKTLREYHDPVHCESGPNCAACKVLQQYDEEWR